MYSASSVRVVVVANRFAVSSAIATEMVRSDVFLFRLFGDEVSGSPQRLKDREGLAPSQRTTVVPVILTQDGDFHPHAFEEVARDAISATDVLCCLCISESDDSYAAFCEDYIQRRVTAEKILVHHLEVTLSSEDVDRGIRELPKTVSAVKECLIARARRIVFEFLHNDVPRCDAWKDLESTTSAALPVPLLCAPGFVTAGNVRTSPFALLDPRDHDELVVDPKYVGREGDVVYGVVHPPQRRGDDTDRATGKDFVYVVDADGTDMFFSKPFAVIAPLGNRQSSTHVSGVVPEDGVLRGRDDVHWIAGESGLVGVLQYEGAASNSLAELSCKFTLIGVLRRQKKSADEDADPASPISFHDAVNLQQLARRPKSQELHIPIFGVAGTSAEAGKTTLASKLVRILTTTCGKKVGAVKATGTGGVIDCAAYRAMGAHAAFDQVDVGLPSTYTSPQRVRGTIGNALLLCQDAGCDVIVMELGGDIIWANNPTVLAMPIVAEHLRQLFVLCNDSMAALGVVQWLRGHALVAVPMEYTTTSTSTNRLMTSVSPTNSHQRHLLRDDQYSLVASPFRSFSGAVHRAKCMDGVPLPLDPNDQASLTDVVQRHW